MNGFNQRFADNLEEYENPEWYDLENATFAEEVPLLSDWAHQLGSPVVELACGTVMKKPGHYCPHWRRLNLEDVYWKSARESVFQRLGFFKACQMMPNWCLLIWMRKPRLWPANIWGMMKGLLFTPWMGKNLSWKIRTNPLISSLLTHGRGSFMCWMKP